MKQSYILLVTGALVLLGGCRIYRPYSRPEVAVNGLYRDTLSNADTLKTDTANLGNLPWQDVFKDASLQQLIEKGLTNNPDLQIAILRVQESQAMVLASRLAYAPSLALSPAGTISSLDKGAATKTYQLPVTAGWEIDLFGKLLNAKRGARATLLQSDAYRQAVRTQVVAAVANYYYMLLMLDRQLAISEQTAAKWVENVQTMKALKEAGMVNEAAVVQSEANSYMVTASLVDLKRQVRENENALCLLLGEGPHAIDRGVITAQQLPEVLSAGVPVQLLANRPDVKAAEMALSVAYYATNQARSSFYPQLSINGSAGWTNSAGGAIFNPAVLIATATASLVQPLFNKGQNIARLKVAKAQQEEARISFNLSLLNAGNEVSNALYQYQSAVDKTVQREKQINALEKSVEYTTQLLTLGTSTYLEVLTAQQSLLNAQLTEVSDRFQQLQSVVYLYQALGGGR